MLSLGHTPFLCFSFVAEPRVVGAAAAGHASALDGLCRNPVHACQWRGPQSYRICPWVQDGRRAAVALALAAAAAQPVERQVGAAIAACPGRLQLLGCLESRRCCALRGGVDPRCTPPCMAPPGKHPCKSGPASDLMPPAVPFYLPRDTLPSRVALLAGGGHAAGTGTASGGGHAAGTGTESGGGRAAETGGADPRRCPDAACFALSLRLRDHLAATPVII